jgi:hypothetical protein
MQKSISLLPNYIFSDRKRKGVFIKVMFLLLFSIVLDAQTLNSSVYQLNSNVSESNHKLSSSNTCASIDVKSYMKVRFFPDEKQAARFPKTLSISISNQEDWFVVKSDYVPITNKMQKNYSVNTFTIAPNPIQNQAKVIIPLSDSNTYDRLEIIDLYGRLVYSLAISEGEKVININTANLANGTYQCALYEKGNCLARSKFCKISQ